MDVLTQLGLDSQSPECGISSQLRQASQQVQPPDEAYLQGVQNVYISPITITEDRFYPTGPYDNLELNLRLKKAKQYLLTRSSK